MEVPGVFGGNVSGLVWLEGRVLGSYIRRQG